MKGRQTTVYRETYKVNTARIKDHLKPQCVHQVTGFTVDEAFLLAAGKVREADGREREYHDIRVYFTEGDQK